MLKNFKVISLIPAKKRSTQLKNKNLLKIKGISLVERAIKSSLYCRYIDHTFLSSDSKKILNIKNKYDIIPIVRPKKFSTKKSLANDVIYHAIKVIKKKLINYKDVICVYLQPTSPFRNHKHIDQALRLFLKSNVKSLISIEENHKSIYKSVLIKNRKIFPFFKESYINSNRQFFQKTYSPNGAIYIFKIKDFLKKKTIPIKNSTPYLMSKHDSLDIDDFFDFKIAQFLA